MKSAFTLVAAFLLLSSVAVAQTDIDISGDVDVAAGFSYLTSTQPGPFGHIAKAEHPLTAAGAMLD